MEGQGEKSIESPPGLYYNNIDCKKDGGPLAGSWADKNTREEKVDLL